MDLYIEHIITVWPEILSGRYFGGLLYVSWRNLLWRLRPVLSHNDIHSKMANRTRWESLTGP